MESTEWTLAVLAGIFLLGTGAQWLAWRFRLPAILLLLITGCAAGSEVGFLRPEELFGDLLLPCVSLAVGLVLFEGSLNLRFRDLKGIWKSLLGLLTIGVVISWSGGTLGGMYLLGLPIPEALVLGAILTVTGPTVIGPLLREIRPSGRVGTIAKWEGITIDPIGAMLALLSYEAIDSIRQEKIQSATMNALSVLGSVSAIGIVVGLMAAFVLTQMLKRFWIPDHLRNPMTLMFVIGAYTGAEMLHHEAGLLATTVMGIAMANQRMVDIHSMIEFKESLAMLLISTLFILLSARVPLSSLRSLGWEGPAYAGFLILVVRPLSVWISTIGSGLTKAERGLLCWLAPRGIVAAAVSSVLALRLGESGEKIAPAVFVVIFITVTVYGLTSGWVARWLGLSSSDAQGLLIAGSSQTARLIASALQKEGFRVVLVDTNRARIRKARDAGLIVCYANVMSEHVLDEVDFSGMGRFLALTSNDEINTLAVTRFRGIFGNEQIFQLSREKSKLTRMETDWQKRMSGRALFAPDLTYEVIDDSIDAGATIKVTGLTETFSFESYKEHYGSRAWPLFIIEGKKLQVVVAESPPTPKAGQLIVSLVMKGVEDPVIEKQSMKTEK